MQQVQQAVDLLYRQIRHPALQESSICILQHPQETHQQSPAALSRQRAGLAPSLVKTNTQTQWQSFHALQFKMAVYRGLQGKGTKSHLQAKRSTCTSEKKNNMEMCLCGARERAKGSPVKLRQQPPTQNCDLSVYGSGKQPDPYRYHSPLWAVQMGWLWHAAKGSQQSP